MGQEVLLDREQFVGASFVFAVEEAHQGAAHSGQTNRGVVFRASRQHLGFGNQARGPAQTRSPECRQLAAEHRQSLGDAPDISGVESEQHETQEKIHRAQRIDDTEAGIDGPVDVQELFVLGVDLGRGLLLEANAAQAKPEQPPSHGPVRCPRAGRQAQTRSLENVLEHGQALRDFSAAQELFGRQVA